MNIHLVVLVILGVMVKAKHIIETEGAIERSKGKMYLDISMVMLILKKTQQRYFGSMVGYEGSPSQLVWLENMMLSLWLKNKRSITGK